MGGFTPCEMPVNPDALPEGLRAELEKEGKVIGAKQRTVEHSRPNVAYAACSTRSGAGRFNSSQYCLILASVSLNLSRVEGLTR